MAKHLKLFNNHDDYSDFKETTDFILPNVSHCIEENEVHYNPIINYAYVDLGLPSGTLWATMNIGANSETEIGDLFVWGETQPRYDLENNYAGDDIKYLQYDDNARVYKLTKYCSREQDGYDGFVDNKTVLDLEDDAAHIQWGGDWRTPTAEDFDELISNTDFSLEDEEGSLLTLTSTVNGEKLYFPSVYSSGGSTYGTYSYAMSSTISTLINGGFRKYYLAVYYPFQCDVYANDRGRLCPIRPVKNSVTTQETT